MGQIFNLLTSILTAIASIYDPKTIIKTTIKFFFTLLSPIRNVKIKNIILELQQHQAQNTRTPGSRLKNENKHLIE